MHRKELSEVKEEEYKVEPVQAEKLVETKETEQPKVDNPQNHARNITFGQVQGHILLDAKSF